MYAVLLETHPAARSERLVLPDLAKDNWILFSRPVHPTVHDAILNAARRQGVIPKKAHDIMGVRQATHLVSEGLGVAILSEPLAQEIHAKGIAVKALFDESLLLQTSLIRRADDNSQLTKVPRWSPPAMNPISSMIAKRAAR